MGAGWQKLPEVAGGLAHHTQGMGQSCQEELAPLAFMGTLYRDACYFLGREEEGPMAGSLEGLGQGSTTGATRRLLTRASTLFLYLTLLPKYERPVSRNEHQYYSRARHYFIIQF